VGVSASIPLAERPMGQRVIAALRQHNASHVVALKLDRLSRRGRRTESNARLG